MTDKNLFSAIGNIDEKYIEEAADEKAARPKLFIIKYAVAAAALLIVITVSIVAFTNLPQKNRTQVVAFGGLGTAGNNNMLGVHGSTSISSGIMLDDENTESVKPGEEESDILSDNENLDSKKDQSNISTTRPNGLKDTRYISVYISLENGCYYHYDAGIGFSVHNIPPITEDDLGEKITVLTENNINRTHLVGCEIFRHKQIDCDR